MLTSTIIKSTPGEAFTSQPVFFFIFFHAGVGSLTEKWLRIGRNMD